MDMRVSVNDQNAASHIEQRGAPRSSLLMRVAKLICGDREYACVVRDVSATGVKLRLFHEPPRAIRVMLELANGDRHAMQRVWANDQEAGFRFDQVINIERFMSEVSRYPRRPLRLNLRCGAKIALGGAPVSAAIRNLSQHGGCVETDTPLAIGQRIQITIDGLPQRVASVRWRRDGTFGLVFQDTLTLDRLAAFAFACQPVQEDGDGWNDAVFPAGG